MESRLTWKQLKEFVEGNGVKDKTLVCFISIDEEDLRDGCKLAFIRNDDNSFQIVVREEVSCF